MSQALYRKYRSKSFNEIVGQKATVNALQTAVKSNKISHAYLFSGPRGVGKTSIARILAYEITKMQYQEDSLPIDIIEIDAASNRGIDEVRDLREKVRIAPVSAPFKVYIIDEVHMLTTPAFNALLKTLEEPPKHVVFILATTESYKLPETILSRTQRYSFKLASFSEVENHLEYIAKQENINIDKDSIKIIAQHSGGSLRDALSALDHVRHASIDITKQDTMNALGVPPYELIESIYSAIRQNNPSMVLNALETAEQSNSSAITIARQLQSYLTELIKNNQLEISLKNATEMLKELIKVETAQDPSRQLFIALISCLNDSPINSASTNVIKPKPKELIKKNNKVDDTPQPKNEDNIKQTPKTKSTSVESKSIFVKTKQGIVTKEDWQTVLESLRSTHNTLYGLLRMASFSSTEDNKVTLTFNFDFHQKRVNDSKNKKYLQDALESVGYKDTEILTKYNKENINKLKPTEPKKDKNDTGKSDKEISSVENIFGSVEVLE